jgi:hypothetical protein
MHVRSLCPSTGQQIQCGCGGDPGTSLHARRTVLLPDDSSLKSRIDPGPAADVNRPHAAYILEIVDEPRCDLFVWGRTDGRG